jgi:UDP-4-amino-4,6-dideoxy-N-acetyl-beta-L-altrosamine transaminase
MSKLNRLLHYSRQLIEEDDIEEVVKVLRSDFITQGPMVERFEKALAKYVGAKYCVVFSSGTAALHGAYFAAGLAHGDEFITTPNTFAATSNAGLYLGARPIFVDIESDTGNIDPNLIEQKITPKTKLVTAVDYSGHPADIDAIRDIAKDHDLIFIEDAAHALGAEYKGKKVGSFADMTIFSFHPVKIITTGEGGAVCTNNEKFYEKLVIFRQHGITKDSGKFLNPPDGDWYYEMQELGYNYRLTDIQCALGLSQLKKIDRFLKERRKIAKRYMDDFVDVKLFELPVEKEYAKSSWHLFPIKLRDYSKKAEIFRELRENGILVQVHYIPVYWHPYYQRLGYSKGLCPKAEEFYKKELSIPVFPGLSEEEIAYIEDTLLKVVQKYSR